MSIKYRKSSFGMDSSILSTDLLEPMEDPLVRVGDMISDEMSSSFWNGSTK
jgi:hypothetical protein